MNKIMPSQQYETYLDEDHGTWALLSRRQGAILNGSISREYYHGFEKLQLDRERIIDIGELSRRLESISGWTLIPVSGLIPTKDFFYMLVNKRYPVTVSIRRPEEVDFSEQPDIFHDVWGHLPMLVNARFTSFLTAFSIIALKYINNDRAVELLGRLYWFTYEMGIILEEGGYKPYGGALITSASELANLRDEKIPKYAFDVDKVFRTPYNSFALQREYFVIASFDDLFNCLEQLEERLIEQLLLPEEDLSLHNFHLNRKIGRQFNDVIGFLNDTQYRHPDAISFVAGQPDERFFEVEDKLSRFSDYVEYMAGVTGESRENVTRRIGQYGKTKGLVNDLVAEYLRRDENINIKGEQILMTVGAQEAFAIIVSTVCERDTDVILTEDPSYIGLSSFAGVFGYPVAGVATDDEGIDLRKLREKIVELTLTGKNPKLLYVIPDYQNPSGSCMPIGNRLKLLDMARKYNFLIIEDSVYNSFTYAQKKNPTLKSLDRYNRVIFVGSFSKSLFPGLRMGFIAANQQVESEWGSPVWLIDQMAKVKAVLTNNTPAVCQAILGGILVSLNFSLHQWCEPKFRSYKQKRDRMLAALNRWIGVHREGWAREITWNQPDGGFFIKLVLPFEVDKHSVSECASEYNVIFCPMRYFYLASGGEKELRLTFSNLPLEHIDLGVERLAAYLKKMTIRQLNLQTSIYEK